jgi:NTP pyrophosphatase (non-canonical NTP hydrolase)
MSVLSFDEYQQGVLSTWNSTQSEASRITNAIFGLCGESGELADLVKKDMFHGVPADRDKILKELGDILYYVTVTGYEFGFNLEHIAITNNAKLAARYPQGFVKGGGIRE